MFTRFCVSLSRELSSFAVRITIEIRYPRARVLVFYCAEGRRRDRRAIRTPPERRNFYLLFNLRADAVFVEQSYIVRAPI